MTKYRQVGNLKAPDFNKVLTPEKAMCASLCRMAGDCSNLSCSACLYGPMTLRNSEQLRELTRLFEEQLTDEL